MILEHLQKKLLSYAKAEAVQISNISILIAFSGGLDSVVLLDCLRILAEKNGFRIGAAHVNHGLRDQAEEDESFCITTCKKHNLPFFVTRLDASRRKGSMEDWARTERYAWLEQIAKTQKYHWILTAHHLDDQLETLFMRNLQNGDWTSMLGIRELRGKLRRPLLDVSKQELTDYARSNGLDWREDSTNRDLSFLRNRIRFDLLPAALKLNPSLSKDLLGQQLQAQKRLLEISENLAGAAGIIRSGEPGALFVLDRSAFTLQGFDERKIFLQKLIRESEKGDYISVSAGHWQAFWQFIDKSDTGTIFDLSETMSCLFDRGRLVFFGKSEILKTHSAEVILGTTCWFDGILIAEKVDKLVPSIDKLTVTLNQSTFNSGLYIRSWKPGDRMISGNSMQSVKLSNLYSDRKFSHLMKVRQPVLVDSSDQILWLPGILHSSQVSRFNTLEKKMVKLIWQKM